MLATLQKNFDLVTNLLRFSDTYTSEEIFRFTGGRVVYPGVNWYFSPVNAVNLYEFPDMEIFKKIPFVTVRDGLFSLLFFFHMIPEPKGIETKFIIHESLINFVPEAWLPNILLWRHEINTFNRPYSELKRDLIITANLDQFAFNKEQFIKMLEESKDFAAKNKIKNIKTLLFCRRNPHLLSREDQSRYYAQRTAEVTEILNDTGNLKFVTWKKLRASNDTNLAYVHDYNSQAPFHLDSFLNHMFWSKGCLPTETQKIDFNPESAFFQRHSNFHGITIHCELPKQYVNKTLIIEDMKKSLGVKKASVEDGYRGNESLFKADFLDFLDEISSEERGNFKFYQSN